MKRGEITAFLSLIFVLLLSFITAMLESTVIQAAKSQKRMDVDRAIFSLFGEYDTKLLDEYEILAIDGGFGTGTYREETLTDHMRYYGTDDMEHEIQGIQYLTDNGGMAFREQILAYMESVYGIALIRDLTDQTGVWQEQELQGEKANQNEAAVNDELESILSENENSLPAKDNPLPHMQEIKKSGLLELVLPEGFSLSEKQVAFQEQLGARPLQQGRGSFPMRQGIDGIEGRLLFHEYVLKKFGNALENCEQERNLSYEVEYILGGEMSDAENLSRIVKQLIGIRFGINYLYLQTDAAKQAEAEALALTLSTLIALPVVTGAVKQALLASWAFGESLVDVRALLKGRKTALVKSAANWQLSLSSLLTLGTSDDHQEGMDVEGGMSYKDYLRVLLFLKEENTLTMKAMERMEQNIRSVSANEKFCIDHCVVRLKISNRARIRDGLTYQFPVSFGYNWEVGISR